MSRFQLSPFLEGSYGEIYLMKENTILYPAFPSISFTQPSFFILNYIISSLQRGCCHSLSSFFSGSAGQTGKGHKQWLIKTSTLWEIQFSINMNKGTNKQTDTQTIEPMNNCTNEQMKKQKNKQNTEKSSDNRVG